MAWVKQSDRLWSDARFCALSDGAQALWHRANSYLADHLLDGELPEGALKFLQTRKRYVQELEESGYWIRQPSGGWLAADWQEIIQSKAQVLARRSQTLQRVRGHRNGVTNAGCNAAPGPGPGPVRSADADLGSAAAAPSAHEQQIRGFKFVASLLGRSTFDIPPVGSFAAEYGWIGSRPDSEHKRVASTVNAEEWCKANPSRVDAPHLQRSWQKYLAGPVKQIVRAVPQQRSEPPNAAHALMKF